MTRILSTCFITALLLLLRISAWGCACAYICDFKSHVAAVYSNYQNNPVDMQENIVIVKAVVLDTIPGSHGVSKMKLLRQFYGRPVKDTFNYFPLGTDCDLNINYFYQRRTDTMFIVLHRYIGYGTIYGDTIGYSQSTCGKPYAIVMNDSVVEACSGRFAASAIADYLMHIAGALGIVVGSPMPQIAVYPNPFHEKLTIAGAAGTVAIVSNSIGQILARYNISGYKEEIPLRQLPAGAYILRIQSADGATLLRRIIKY